MIVRWSRPALEDFEAAGRYIAERDPDAARRFEHRIFERVGLLAEHPYSSRPGRVSGTRELYVSGTPYIVVYRVAEDAIEIVGFMHFGRDWPTAF